MPQLDLTQLVATNLAADILKALADALEQDLQDKNSDTTYKLKRQATIQGLRELAEHESSW
jgi:hypothetical protein